MKYLPFEDITYKTKLDSEEILRRIKNIIEPKRSFRMAGIFGSSNQKPYEGAINGMSFNISRIIGYKNSFLPRITGTVGKNLNGTKINVKMRLHPFVVVFMFIWFAGVGIGCLAVLPFLISNKDFEPALLVPLGMLFFGYALVTGGFKYESLKSKTYLAELFEAEIENVGERL